MSDVHGGCDVDLDNLELSTSQKLGMVVLDGIVYAPIPKMSTEAFELYQRNATYNVAISALADRVGVSVEEVLRSGPDCIEIELDRLGVFDDA